MSRHRYARILLVIPYGGVGGMERLAETLYRQYRSAGHLVKVVKVVSLKDDVVTFGSDELFLSKEDLSGMSIERRLWFYACAPYRLRKLVQQYGITHSIAFGDLANLFSSLTVTREFKVASIHSFKSLEFRSGSMLTRVSRLAYRSLYGVFDRVVSISSDIRRDLLENHGYAFGRRLQVIYNPHDVAWLQRRGAAAVEPRQVSMFDKPYVLFLGRISEQKAPWRLIEAFSWLVKSGVDVNLVVIGDGSPVLLDRLRLMVVEAGLSERVFFVGRLSNPYPYLKRAAVVGLTSTYEGTPNVIVEAIALGVPVVSSYCTGGISELMCSEPFEEPKGTAPTPVAGGFITPNYPIEGVVGPSASTGLDRLFAEGLKEAILDPEVKARLISSRSALLSKFDVERVASEYLR